MRRTGVTIGTPIARAIIMAHIRRANVLSLTSFRFSDNWVRLFLHQQMKWSVRKTTRATTKIPDDWEIQCRRTHGCMAYQIKMHGITDPDLVVNYDHSGQGLAPMGNTTWEERGAKQVRGASHDDKRQVSDNIDTLT